MFELTILFMTEFIELVPTLIALILLVNILHDLLLSE